LDILKIKKHNYKMSSNLSLGVKYIDLNSTFRNRKLYPLQSDFVVPLRTSNNISIIQDPVFNATPYTLSIVKQPPSLVTQTSTANDLITLDADETSVDNAYVDSYLTIDGVSRLITAYDGTTKVATLSTPLTSLPAPSTSYFTRKELPLFTSTVAAITDSYTIQLDDTPSNLQSAVLYLRIATGTLLNEMYSVASIAGDIVTFSTAMSSGLAPGDTIELMALSRDNVAPLLYPSLGTETNTTGLYEISLISLTIPKSVFNNGYGGIAQDYPYFYVALYNEGDISATQVLISNNPNSPLALFKVPIDDYSDVTTFYTLKHSNSTQIVRFNPLKDIRLKVYLPDGPPLSFAQSDNFSPSAPNPLLQISAYFSLKKHNKI
jgi:hypothetical protein